MKRRLTNIVGSVVLAGSFIFGTSSAASVQAQDWRYRQNHERREERERHERREEWRNRHGYDNRNYGTYNQNYDYNNRSRLRGWYDRFGNFHPYRRY